MPPCALLALAGGLAGSGTEHPGDTGPHGDGGTKGDTAADSGNTDEPWDHLDPVALNPTAQAAWLLDARCHHKPQPHRFDMVLRPEWDEDLARHGDCPGGEVQDQRGVLESHSGLAALALRASEPALATLIGTAEMIRSAGRDSTHVVELIDAAHTRTLELGQRLEADLAREVQDG